MAHYEQLALVSRGLQLRCSLHACSLSLIARYTYLQSVSSVSSVSSCTDSFICSLFILSSPTRSRIFDKREDRDSFNPSYST